MRAYQPARLNRIIDVLTVDAFKRIQNICMIFKLFQLVKKFLRVDYIQAVRPLPQAFGVRASRGAAMNIINHNLMAANVAKNLNSHYGKLATSIERLSSGLSINSAADDAAGLAIRELMRADVAALNQGVRNAMTPFP